MRLSVLPLLIAGLALASCSSNSGSERVAANVSSKETTGSVSQPTAPVPAANVGAPLAQGQASTSRQTLAWAEPVSAPSAFSRQTTVGMPLPSDRPITTLMPEQPEIDSAPARGRMQIYSRRFRDAKPINFGRVSPKDYAVHGVDVSRWQGEIDWVKLRTQGANFAYIKATDGGDHLDPMFKTNWRRAKEAGLKRGAYHFFYWCRTAGEQADWFIRNVPRDPDALPPVIDVEWNGESRCKQRLARKRVLEKMQVFMDKLERHYGQRPIIYTAPDFYEDNLTGEFLNYPFWLRAVAQHPSKVYPGRKWVFWQYSGSGLSHGVDGKIDLNVFHGGVEQWHNWISPRTAMAQH